MNLDKIIFSAMTKAGLLIPRTIKDVENAEKYLSINEIDLPNSLKNPYYQLEGINERL